MLPFTERAIQIIKNIPKGKVMTYGQIAKLAGNHRAARQVSRLLHSMSRKYSLPWHRVVNAEGKISLSDERAYNEQRTILESEGIEFGVEGNIDLKKYGWNS